MAEYFNRKALLSGNVPLGSFNSAFSFSGSKKIDAAATKSLAMDGIFIPLCKVQLIKQPSSLQEDVRCAVPLTWDPSSLARYWRLLIVKLMLSRMMIYSKLSCPLQIHRELWNSRHHIHYCWWQGCNLCQTAQFITLVNDGHKKLYTGYWGSKVFRQ